MRDVPALRVAQLVDRVKIRLAAEAFTEAGPIPVSVPKGAQTEGPRIACREPGARADQGRDSAGIVLSRRADGEIEVPVSVVVEQCDGPAKKVEGLRDARYAWSALAKEIVPSSPPSTRGTVDDGHAAAV